MVSEDLGFARHKKMKQHATPEGIDTHLNEIAGQFLDIVFPYAVVFGSLTMAVSLYRSWIHGWYSTIIWHTIMYGGSIAVILFRRRLPSILAISTILAFICIDVFRSLYLMGLTDGGVTGLVVLGILVGIFIGIRAGIAAILLGTAAAAVIGVLICTGLVVPLIDEGRYLRSPDAWFLQLSVVLVYALPLVVTAHILRQRVSRSVSELQEMNGRLRSEVAMRRQAEGDSRNIEIKYREILERAGEGIFQMNLDGRFLAVNPALAHMTGYAFPQEMLADQDRNMYSIFTNREDETCLIEKARYGEGIENLEMEIRTRDLRTVWVRINMRCIRGEDGSPDYLEGTVQDITGWRMAEVALQESELKYRSVVENSLVASYIIQDGFFRFVNTTFSVLTGYSREELTEGMMPADIVHPEYRKAWREAMNGTAYGQPDMLELELRIQKKDGNAVAVKALAGSTSYNGRVAIFGTFIDISKEKALEAQLRQAQKMEAIGTLTGGIAHDFNNILTALTGYATLLQMRLGEADPLRHYVDQILSASNKATSLTQSLLTFGRRQPISLRPVDIRSVVEGTQSLLQRLITEDISLVTKFTDDPMIVMADTTQIDQILFNLATNARDAMPDGGTLAISVDRVFMGNDFMEANGFGKAGTYAMLSVADTCVGLDDETRELIFDPFFTT
jgi:PAS domain S-box-containing protein